VPSSVERAALAATFDESSRKCEEAVARHVAARAEPPSVHFSSGVTLAIGLLSTVAAREVDVEDIRLVHDACATAAAVCRTEPPDEAVVEAATVFAAVEWTCLQALDVRAIRQEGVRWRRFLFPDADVEAARGAGQWVVRSGGVAAENRVLRAALERVLRCSQSRLDAITVQILAWDAHAGND
jgi:hypothetical protein